MGSLHGGAAMDVRIKVATTAMMEGNDLIILAAFLDLTGWALWGSAAQID